MRTGARVYASILLLAIAISASSALAQFSLDDSNEEVESIYAPRQSSQEQGANTGGVNFNFSFEDWTDYIYRGLDRGSSDKDNDSSNLQFDGQIRFDLGRYPSLFLGVFTNVEDRDPISRFQEIRPYFGLDITARPFKFAAGNTFYIYPERDQLNTAEVWAKLTIDDSYFFRTEEPVFSPYVLAAWDYDTYHGWYMEAGIRHDCQIEDTALTVSPIARVAYVTSHREFALPSGPVLDPGFSFGNGTDSGFQHYDIGMEFTYTLNGLLNIPSRYGKIDVKADLFYTDGISNDLRSASELYGGLGLGFSY